MKKNVSAALLKCSIQIISFYKAKTSPTQKLTTKAKPVTILLVEDDCDISAAVAEILESEGFELLMAWDGAKALAILEKEPADLVLSDVMMPRMDGIELLRKIRSSPKYGRVPVILMSAVFPPPDASLEYDAFLKKPFDVHTLLATVSKIFSTKMSSR